ncbi:MAG: type II secretion system F family protein [Candidatus Micrarchaeota archaeon]
MARKMRFYYILSQLIPTGLLDRISSMIVRAGFTYIDPRKYAGFMVLFTLIASAAAGYVTSRFFLGQWLIPLAAFAFTFALVSGLFYFVLFSAAENRARNVEEILPDALKMIAANIRAGMTVENAIWSVSKPEFGVFGQEIKRVSLGTYAGRPIAESLQDMTTRVDSKLLERSMRLLTEGIRLGGEIANLLDEVADTIKSAKVLKKEIQNATITYALFIIFSALLIAPMLFAVSLYYSQINEKLLAKQQAMPELDKSTPGAAKLLGGDSLVSKSFSKKGQSITSTDIRNFSLAAIIITAFCSALLLGLIQSGKAARGIKMVPIFVPVAVGVYFLIHSLINSAFSTILV